MKFSFLTSCAPGKDLAAQCAAIGQTGCDGIETIVFSQDSLSQWQKETRKGAGDQGLEISAVIIGGLALNQPGQGGWIKEVIHAIAEIGAAGALITPEYRAQDPLPLLPPYPAPPAAEQEQVDSAVAEIAEAARQYRVQLFCEPITPFQTRFWRDTDSVLSLCRHLNNPFVGLALDFWVMNLTEKNINDCIKQVGSYVKHVHLTDNNRLLPGQGHIDFASGFKALKEIQYNAWCSFECAAEGNFIRDVKESLNWLKQLAG